LAETANKVVKAEYERAMARFAGEKSKRNCLGYKVRKASHKKSPEKTDRQPVTAQELQGTLLTIMAVKLQQKGANTRQTTLSLLLID
jgi:hypothetical protein